MKILQLSVGNTSMIQNEIKGLFLSRPLPLPFSPSFSTSSPFLPSSFHLSLATPPPPPPPPQTQLLPGDNDLCQLRRWRLLVLQSQQVERPHRGRPCLSLVHLDHGCLHRLLLQEQEEGQLAQEDLPGLQKDHHTLCNWPIPECSRYIIMHRLHVHVHII